MRMLYPLLYVLLHPLSHPLLAQVAQAVGSREPTSLWPTTLAGWLALLLSLAAALGGVVAWGRLLEKLNGYGARLKEVEVDIGRLKETQQTMTLALERVLAAQGQLLERIGEAKRSGEGCEDSMREYAVEIGTKIDLLTREVHASEIKVAERLQGIETELRINRQRGD